MVSLIILFPFLTRSVPPSKEAIKQLHDLQDNMYLQSHTGQQQSKSQKM